MLVFVVVTLAFTSLEYRNASCRSIKIDYKADEVIHIEKDELLKLIMVADSKILGKKLDQINAEVIEEAVEKHDAILEAEVYKMVIKGDTSAFKGVLGVKVKHREPVMRIMSGTGSYYLDEYGGKIPVSKNYTANVLVTTGIFDEKFAREQLLPCILYIENSEFWEAQIEQVHIEKDGNAILIPLVGDHLIEMGKLDNYQEKLRNMKAFYKKVLADDNWNKYKTVSLKYKNQVIAKRR